MGLKRAPSVRAASQGANHAPKLHEREVGRRENGEPPSLLFDKLVDKLLHHRRRLATELLVVGGRKEDLVEADLLNAGSERRKDLREKKGLVERRERREEGARDEVDVSCDEVLVRKS